MGLRRLGWDVPFGLDEAALHVELAFAVNGGSSEGLHLAYEA